MLPVKQTLHVREVVQHLKMQKRQRLSMLSIFLAVLQARLESRTIVFPNLS